MGEKTEEHLARLGLRTVADIANTPLATLQRALGQASGTHLHELSWGRDPRPVTPHEPEKSVGNEETFEHDIDDPVIIHAHLLRLSDQVAGRLRAAGYVGRTVSLKVRFADFSTITRSRTLTHSTDVGKEIYDTVRGLYESLGLQRVRIRLVGVRMEGLADAQVAVDALRARYGSAAVRPARLVDPDPRLRDTGRA